MLKHQLLLPEGILILEPDAPLEAADFDGLVREIDPYIAEHGKLSGLMIHAKAFPGWANLEAFLAHMQFIRSHHQKIVRLAMVTESNPTCNKRFARLGIPQTEDARRAYRELIVTTPGLGECISGAILYDETIRQQKKDGTPFLKVLTDAKIIPGIKVDTGAKALAAHPGEKITEGLDGLRERLAEYARMGARFAKWRAVLAIGEGLPTPACIEVNAHALARYSALCQEATLVAIVEPEVLMDGHHTVER